MFHSVITWLVETVGDLGYLGIFLLMFLESTFFPFPSEVVMIPAGFLVYKGEMNLFFVIFFGTLGSLFGALLNYFLAMKLGRLFLLRYGKYIFFKPHHLEKIESFFSKHGDISTFSGRLVVGVRQYISIPAGLARMNLIKFSLYTSLGALIWVSILTIFGYFIGQNKELIEEYLWIITVGAILFVVLLCGIYYYFKIYKKKQE